MKTVFLIYKTDVHHSYASRDIIGISSSALGAINLCIRQAKKEYFKIGKEQLWNLRNISQTQGLYEKAGFEFSFESMVVGQLI